MSCCCCWRNNCIARALLSFTCSTVCQLPFNSGLQKTTESLSQIQLFNLFWLTFKRGSVSFNKFERDKTTKIHPKLQGIDYTWAPHPHMMDCFLNDDLCTSCWNSHDDTGTGGNTCKWLDWPKPKHNCPEGNKAQLSILLKTTASPHGYYARLFRICCRLNIHNAVWPPQDKCPRPRPPGNTRWAQAALSETGLLAPHLGRPINSTVRTALWSRTNSEFCFH